MSIEHGHKRRTLSKKTAAVAAAVAIGTPLAVAAERSEFDLQDSLYRLTTDQSLIVAEVPGQVETWDHKKVYNGKVFVDKYWLGIEQCPADIESAKSGAPTQSFNPELGVRNPECHFDWVRVSGDTLGATAIGSTIQFNGDEVGEPLRK